MNQGSKLSIGLELCQARLFNNLLIDQVAKAINIKVSILNALEHERFEEIGAPVYVRGYLKRYALFLELDSVRLDNALIACLQNIEPVILMAPQTTKSPYLFYYGISLTLFLLSSGYYYIGHYPSLTEPDNTKIIEQYNLAMEDAKTPPNYSFSTPKSTDSRLRSVDIQAIAPPLTGSESLVAPAILKANSPVLLEDSRNVSIHPTNTSSAQGVLVAEHPAEEKNKLVIVVDGNNWTEIRDAEGKRVFAGMLVAGQTYAASGVAPFKIKFGNVQTVVSIHYNGVEVAQDLIKVNPRVTVYRMVVGEKSERSI